MRDQLPAPVDAGRRYGPLGCGYSSAKTSPLKAEADMYLFRARPIAYVAATMSRHAPHRRSAAHWWRHSHGREIQRSLGWSNSRYVMIAGYIDESCRVKKFAVCQCEFPRPLFHDGNSQPCRTGTWAYGRFYGRFCLVRGTGGRRPARFSSGRHAKV